VTDDMWQYYYRPSLDLVNSNPRFLDQMLQEPVLMPVEHLDIQIGVLPAVLRLLVEHQWAAAKRWCEGNASRLRGDEYQVDGIRVVAGRSWLVPFEGQEMVL